MKISVDGGALCIKGNNRFGNYSFTKNLIEAIQKYDEGNEYFVYSFCQKPAWFTVDKKTHYKLIKPTTLWLSTRVSLEEMRDKKDIFLALNQAVPFSTRSQIISFSHGLSFYFFPRLYPDSFHALKDQLNPMVKKSKYVIVASSRVKAELKKLFPTFTRFITMNYGVPFDMLDYQEKVKKKYFLFVGMNHRIKNLEFIIKAFKQFKKNPLFHDYKLYLIGNLKQFEDKQENVISFPDLNRDQIRLLYSEAAACLTASFYESFNFPVLEALAQGCPVVGLNSAIIPEFKAFVSCADDAEGFTAKMLEVCQTRGIKIKRKEILARFSWKKYMSKLQELYK